MLNNTFFFFYVLLTKGVLLSNNLSLFQSHSRSCVSFSPAGDRFSGLLNTVVREHIVLLTLGDCRGEKCHSAVTQSSCQCIHSQYHRALTELYHAQYIFIQQCMSVAAEKITVDVDQWGFL